MNNKRRVVITGLGIATSLGLHVHGNWDKVLRGVSGIRSIRYPDSKLSPVRAAGEIDERDWRTVQNAFPDTAAREGERRTLFALWAARSALDDSGVPHNRSEKYGYGVVLAAGLGINRLEDIQRWTGRDGNFDFSKFNRELDLIHRESVLRNNSHRPSALIAEHNGLNGVNCTITTACASATQAIGLAYRSIQRGDADLLVTGGADSMINPVGLVFFVLLNAAAVSPDTPAGICRPFDRKRAGLVMGEGAGIAVLEEESHAVRRGARIYAEVAGYGSSMDAHQVTAPDPAGHGAAKSMACALADAGLPQEEIDYINAHGTSTKLNDTAETLAIKRVFGDKAKGISISSSKSMIGHLLAASGGPEFVYTVLSVLNDEIHPTINLKNPDPKCDLDYVPNAKKSKTVRAALSNSFGFGGQNASIIVKKYIQ